MKSTSHIYTGTKLLLTKTVNSSIDLQYLKTLKTDRTRLLALYKRFYRLRHIIDNNFQHTLRYQELIKWRFSREDFGLRREKVLEKSEDELGSDGIWIRLLNTLDFAHNSTVILPENISEKPVHFYQDLKTPERMERQMVRTILEMHHQKPNDIKYDYKYNWYVEIKRQYDQLPASPTKKELNRILPNPSYIGFRDYELNLMILNEMYNLCL